MIACYPPSDRKSIVISGEFNGGRLHLDARSYLYRCADEPSIPFTVVALRQDAVAKLVQEEGRWRNQLGLT